MKKKAHTFPEPNRRASKNIFQAVLFITIFFFCFSCSNNSETNTGQAKQENKKTEIVKQDTVSPPRITVLDTLADTNKPKQFFLEKTPKPQTITIPLTSAQALGKKCILHWGKDTIERTFEIPMAAPETKFLQVLKNEKGEVIKDKDGSPFILGEAGGYSNFSNYTTDKGLALDAIASGFRDKTGNLWFGTSGGGVSRYDGKSFTNFTTAQGLANNNVLSIAEDKTGNLWFGTSGGGVSRYDGKSFTNFTTAQGLANNTVWSITEDKTGNLWFGTDGGGVSRYDGNRVETIEASLKKGEITPQGTYQDLKKINGKLVKSFTNFTTAQGLPNNNVWSITEDKTGNLWFGTAGGGVSRYDVSRANHSCNKNTCKHDLRIQQDLKEHNNKLAKSFTNFTTGQGLANNNVWSIAEDKTGNLWFGTSGGGVSRYNGSRANHPCNKNTCKHDLRIQQDLKEHNNKLVKFFTNFTTAQGLANNTVLSITEDETGNLWFCTDGGGVSRYDGNRVEEIEASLKRGEIMPQGTEQDLKKINGKLVKSFTNFTTAQGLANNTVWSVTEDKTGNLWFGTDGGGVSRYDGKSFTNFTTAQGLANNTVLSITEDGHQLGTDGARMSEGGNLWFGTSGGGACRYDGKSFTNFTTAQGLANNNVRSITEDKTGNLWFGTYGGGVSRYDGSRVEAIEAAMQRGEIIPERTQQDLKKENGKLVKSFTNFTSAQGLANNNVLSITEDKTGNLWFGTYGGGVSRYDGNRVEAIEASLKRGEIMPQGTEQDLKKINGKLVKSFTNYTTAQGLTNNNVWSITEDKTGNLWFGTQGGGVSRYDGNRVEAIEAYLKRGEIMPQGTEQDLKKINGKLVKSFTNFTTVQGLANNNVWSITEDKTGNLWFGTYGGGVSRYDGSRANHPCNKNTCKHDLLIPQDLKEHNKELAKSFTNFTTAQGLPDNVVTQVVITKEQNIAIGTNLGLAVLTGFKPNFSKVSNFGKVISAQNSLSNQELKNYTPIIEIYNSNTGYPVKDVNTGQNCMFMDSKGIIWAGTGSDKTGLVRFDYAAINKNKMPPDVFIQSVKINNENICWYNMKQEDGIRKTESVIQDSMALLLAQFIAFGKTVPKEILDSQRTKFSGVQFEGITKFYQLPENLVLPHRNNNITFDFAAIEPAKPYLVRYQFILEGYDNDWSPITNATTATFGNIYEGSYTFKLKAQSPFGVWSEPITYTFKVLPPWYRQWLAYLFYVLILVSFIFLIVWWNGRRLRAKAIELKEEVRKATHTITEKQEEIIDSITYAKRIQQAMLPHRKDIWAEFPQSFVLFKPKDIVSGDFYFFNKNNQFAIIAVADCTGHGVPGAFMSMIGSAKLNDAVSKSSDISEILSLLNKGIKTALKQSDSDESTRDGMDIAICSVDIDNRVVKYAGANRPIWIIRNGAMEVEEIKATKRAIGGLTADTQHFDTHELKFQHGDTFYICTDGYADQFGGDTNYKMMTKKFKEILIEIQSKTMKEQKQYLEDFVDNWRGNREQIDDILIIGIRV